MQKLNTLPITFLTSAIHKSVGILNRIPDDKINWRPSESARCALEIGAHIAVGNVWFQELLSEVNNLAKNCTQDKVAKSKRFHEEESKYKTRESVINFINSSSEPLIKILSNFSDNDIQSKSVVMFGKERPLSQFIYFPEGHVNGHISQLEYLETIWGNKD